jgi:hypothetical protein
VAEDGIGISSLFADVFRSAAETPAKTPEAFTILIGSADGIPVALPPQTNMGLMPVELDGLIPPVVQLTVAGLPAPVTEVGTPAELVPRPLPALNAPGTADGVDVIGPGYVRYRVVVDKGDVARSWPTTSTPPPLVFGTDAWTLWFV